MNEQDTPEEVWAPIPGYEGHYECSTLGRVRGLRHNWGLRDCPRILSQKTHVGYHMVNLSKEGAVRSFFVHRLVLLAHVGEPGCGEVCRHLNDVRTDNRLENLAWGSRNENYHDMVRNSGKPGYGDRKGSKNARSKMTEETVREMRELYATGEWTQKRLAQKFGISESQTSHICIRRVWKHVE